VDSGGTFTDVAVFNETDGRLLVWKVSSTPRDPSEAIVEGATQALALADPEPGAGQRVAYFGHGTTVATNALIQGRGAMTGLVTTAGFRDLLELRRQRRPSLYDLQTEKPPLLARRDHRMEVRERVMFDGRVETPLDEDEVRAVAREMKAAGVSAVAVCLLFSFIEPAHEIAVKRILQEELPEAFISVSHEVAPEFREFERLSTVTVNAYLGPIMRDYLGRLRPRLAEAGIDEAPHLTQSNGGIISCEVAQEHPARTVLSGPAAGVMGALAIGELAGIGNLITFDMGGTSTDVTLIDAGRPQFATDIDVHGYPLKLPMLDIHTVGAGGGSIAHLDSGLLKVGPRSAGAVPGPVCYGKGNGEPTVTDANVALGVLNQTHLLNGRMAIDAGAAREAIAALGRELDLEAMQAAQGIISVVIANMAKAIRLISVERGHDPRDYTMLAFGGAGPIHATRLARELEIRRVLVPPNPGILCALGLLLTDLRTNLSLSRLLPLEASHAPDLMSAFAVLEARAEAWFEQEGVAPAQRLVRRTLDMRYAGQNYELMVPCPAGPLVPKEMEALRAAFEQVYRQIYGYVSEDEPIQIVTVRLEATAVVRKAELRAHPPATGPVSEAVLGKRDIWLPEADGRVSCPVYRRERLRPGHAVTGPAIIEQMDSTTLVLPGQTASVDAYMNLLIEERA